MMFVQPFPARRETVHLTSVYMPAGRAASPVQSG